MSDESAAAPSEAAAPSDAEVAACTRAMLADATDLAQLSVKRLVAQLAAEFGRDMAPHKALIKAETMRFVQEQATAAASAQEAEEAEAAEEAAAPRGKFVSQQMFDVIGQAQPGNHFAVNKLLWAYIKANGLQKAGDGRVIVCDAKLRRVFDCDEVTAFAMGKYISQHFLPANADGVRPIERVVHPPPPDPAKAKAKKAAKKAKAPRKKTEKVHKPREQQHWVSAQMAAVIGDERVNDRFVLSKLVWAYIKAHALQDPADKRTIVCDDKFRAVFGVDRINMMTMTRYYSQHLFPASQGSTPAVEVKEPPPTKPKSATAAKKRKAAAPANKRKRKPAADDDDDDDDVADSDLDDDGNVDDLLESEGEDSFSKEDNADDE